MANRFRLPRFAAITVSAAFMILTGCDRTVDPEDDHEGMSRVELEIRATGETAAVWTRQDGWDVDELQPVPAEENGGEALWEDGPRASLTVRIFDDAGDEFNIATVFRDEDTGERECTEYSARFTIAQGADPQVITWQPIIEGGVPSQFAERSDGERVAIFHCDHIYLYPEQEGQTSIQIQLWHIDHPDANTTAVPVIVEASRGNNED